MSERYITPLLKEVFLHVLGETCSVATAAKAAGVGVGTARGWRKRDPDFATAWDHAIVHLAEVLEDEAVRRALDGVDEPIFYLGKQVGAKRIYSDSLLLAKLKALKPEKYRERMEIKAEVDIAEILRAGRRRLFGQSDPAPAEPKPDGDGN